MKFEEMINKIHCADCLKFMKDIPDESIDLVLTDPPYNISQKNKIFRDYRSGKRSDIKMDFGEWDYNFQIEPFLKEAKRVLNDFGSIIVWTSEQLYGKYREWFEKEMYPKQLLVWVKCLHGHTKLLARVNGKVSLTTVRDLYRSSYILGTTVELLAPERKWVKVVNFVENDSISEGKVIYLRNGSKIKVTNNHYFLVNNILVRAKDLKEHDILDNGSNIIQENKDSILRKEEGWLIGLFIAKGNYQKGNEIRFFLNKNEINFFEKLSKLTAKYNGNIRKHISKDGNGMAVIINSHILTGLVKEFVKDKGSKYKHLSNNCWNTNKDFLQGIFKGWLDGDGNYDEKAKKWIVEFAVNTKLNDDMKLLANILGYSYKNTHKFVNAFGKRFKVILSHIKKERTEHFNSKSDYEIIRIINTKLKSYEISLENNHTFLLFDGTIVHNSNPLPQFRLVGYRQATELLYWALKKKNTKNNPNFLFLKQSEMTNVFYAPIVGGEERTIHPTQKPLSITQQLIMRHCREGGIVLDPFLGSGTTAVACKRLKRKFIGIEINPEYCRIAEERLKNEPEPLF